MIELQAVSKSFGRGRKRVDVATDITARFPAGCVVALIGRNGAGKSTLLRMISGSMNPDRGRILRTGSVSWPVGFSGSFHGDLTGAQNIRFLGRAYGVDTDELTAFVEDFAQLGRQFYAPYKSYSSGMKSRLAFGASMAMTFDTYLIDEVTSVGDAAFREKSIELLETRLAYSSAIVVSHGKRVLRRLCNCAAILENGVLTFFNDVDEAICVHEAQVMT